MNNQPPKLPLRFLRWFCDPRLLKYIEGDLLELYKERLEKIGKRRANWHFTWEVVKLFRPGLIRLPLRKRTNMTGIVKDQLRSSFRILIRQKFYASIILGGLAVGLSLSHVIISYLIKIAEIDRHIPNHEQVYRLISDDPFDEGKKIAFILDSTSEYLGTTYPELAYQTSLFDPRIVELETSRETFRELKIIAADSNFLSFFGMDLIAGNATTALSGKGVVLSQEVARKIFGFENPMNQILQLRTGKEEATLTVSGVFDADAYYSHLNYDVIIPDNAIQNTFGGSVSYFRLPERSSPEELESLLAQDSEIPALMGPGSSTYYFQPLKQVYYDMDNTRSFSTAISKQFVVVGWSVAGLILVISLFNFINLFLRASLRRRKEMGIKKVFGVGSAMLRRTLMIDIIVYLGIGFVGSGLISYFAVPIFNQRFDTSLLYAEIWYWKVLLLILGILGILAIILSFYAFLKIRHQEPIRMLYRAGDFKTQLNKYLLTPQFAIAIILTICASTIVRQIDFIKHKPLGFDRELIELRVADEQASQLRLLKSGLLEKGVTSYASICSGNPISGNMIISWELPDGSRYAPYLFIGDHDLVSTLGITMQSDVEAGTKAHYVNQTLVDQFQLVNPIGQKIPGSDGLIAGVFDDFNMVSLYTNTPPTVIILDDTETRNRLLINYKDYNIGSVLSETEKLWKTYFPNTTFQYRLIDDELNRKHQADIRLLDMVIAASVAGILISSFGLFALSWGIIQNRIREISIRKVIGATVTDLVWLLTKSTVVWVLVALLISSPIAYLIAKRWLEQFAYRIDIPMAAFLVVGLGSLLLAGIIVGIHAYRSSMINPLHALKEE